MFITGLVPREKAPIFDDLVSILVQQEERRKKLKPQRSTLALMAKGKQPSKGKPWGDNKGGKFVDTVGIDVKLIHVERLLGM